MLSLAVSKSAFSRMAGQWQHDCSSSAAEPAHASDDTAQLSSLAGSAGQPSDESSGRASDEELYTRVQFRDYYNPDSGEAHWQNAQDELTQWEGRADVHAIGAPRRRSAELPDRTSSLAQNDVPASSTENQRACSAEQPALTWTSSLQDAMHMAWTQGFYVGIYTCLRPLAPSLEAAAPPPRILGPTPSVAASEGETTTRRITDRTRRRILNKKLYWFHAACADDWYNNRIQHAVDAAVEAKTLIKIVFSRALTRALGGEELREDLNALWAGAKRLRDVTGRTGFSLMLDTMQSRLLAPKEAWPSSAEFAEENGELLLVCQLR